MGMIKQKADENNSLRGSGCIDSGEEQEADGSVLKALKNGAGIMGYHRRVAGGRGRAEPHPFPLAPQRQAKA